MPDNDISKAQPSKAKGLGGVFPLRSKNAALLYMYRLEETPIFVRDPNYVDDVRKSYHQENIGK